MTDIGILVVLGNAPIVFHAHALLNDRDRPRAISPIDEADCWRLGGTTSVCYAHCSAMDFWSIIYPVIHVFKDQVLDTNTVDIRWSFYCAQYLNRTSIISCECISINQRSLIRMFFANYHLLQTISGLIPALFLRRKILRTSDASSVYVPVIFRPFW